MAKKELGLKEWTPNHRDPQALRLFQVPFWPDKFRRVYEKARTNRQQVNVAVKRIDHFIKTKGAE